MKNKYLHPIQYWKDMKYIDILLRKMIEENELCKAAMYNGDNKTFFIHAEAFDHYNKEMNDIHIKWGEKKEPL